jgi:hypothetical protein
MPRSADVLKRFQLDTGRRVALVCVLLLLMFAVVEATHAHADGKVQAAPCAICVSAHANAPAITVHVLPVLQALATTAVPFQTEGKTTVLGSDLFIRPPPAA